MKTTKRCPQCGTRFEGRSNKMYCSDKCKATAHQDRNTTPGADSSSYSDGRLAKEDEEKLRIKQQIQREQMKHAERMKQLEMQENQRKRKHELDKLEKKEAAQKLQLLKDRLEQMPPPQALPLAKLEADTEEYEEYEEATMEDEEAEVETESEETQPSLNSRLRRAYRKIVRHYLRQEGKRWETTHANRLLEALNKLITQLERWTDRRNVSMDDYPEVEVLKRIRYDCKTVLKDITKTGLFSKKERIIDLKKRWRNELEASLEWE